MPSFYTVVIPQQTLIDYYDNANFDKFILEFDRPHLEITAFDTNGDIMIGLSQVRLQRSGTGVRNLDNHYRGHFILPKQNLQLSGFDSSSEWLLEPQQYPTQQGRPQPHRNSYVSYKLIQHKLAFAPIEAFFDPSPPA